MGKIDLSNVSVAGFDDIFNSNTNEVPAIMVPLSELHEFKEHPYKVVDDLLEDLVDSIKEKGVIEPGIVRPRKKGGYEIISGHRRRRACELAGLTEMPVRVMEYSDDDATIIMVDSNLHREEIMPSEKAKAYAMKFNAMKHQGRSGGKTLENMADSLGEAEKTVQRYICLSRLNDGLLKLVDTKSIPFMAGYEISFLKEETQTWLVEIIEENDIKKITLSQAAAIRSLERDNNDISPGNLLDILRGKKSESSKAFKFKNNRMKDYFREDENPEKIESTIYELLDIWKTHKNNALFKTLREDDTLVQLPGQMSLDDLNA